MAAHPDLEIGLHRQGDSTYTIELRFRQPGEVVQREPMRGIIQLNLDVLRQRALDSEAYGEALSASLFADPDIRAAFKEIRAITESQNRSLRVRLWIGHTAPELHAIRWETLRDPDTGTWLLTNESFLFSRFLGSSDWRPVQLRPKGSLRALVVVANPVDLDEGKYHVRGHELAPVDVAGEVARARQGLSSLVQRELVSDPDAPGQVTIKNLIGALRDGYDILYLACHGGMLKKGPHLWLEQEDGTAAVVPGSDLIDALYDLPSRERPMLVVLASCESAGAGDAPRTHDAEGALAALGPRLAEAGIPAVLAMQGSIAMHTVSEFMPVFFEQLRQHGQIDQAMAAARGAIRQRPDSWMPVLFMRLQQGSVWFQTGFAGNQPEFEQWAALLSSLRDGRCTPVLGPGMIEFLLGDTAELARRWAKKENIPAAVCDHDSLAQVAQYLSVYQSAHYPRSQLRDHLRSVIWDRYEQDLPADLQYAELDELVAALGAYRRENIPDDPFRILAELPIPIYINSNPDNLLFEALRHVNGKQPKEACLVWKEDLRRMDYLPVYDPAERYRPSPRQPIVYYLQGHLAEPESLVLSEDEHFDYLMRVDDEAEADVPSFIDRALSENALLFLGFQLDDWNFRVLFRSIMTDERRYRRRSHRSVAVQIDMAEGTEHPDRVRRYLELYFGDRISIFWGSADDFIKELWQQWQNNNRAGG